MHSIMQSSFRFTRSAGLVFILLPCLLMAQTAPQRFVTKFRPMADSLSAVYGIPASVILGISMLESGSGTSRNARMLNNFFGIVGKNNLRRTHGIKSRYKQYATEMESFVDFCRLMSRKRFYPSLKGNKSIQQWVRSIAATGYSEAPVVWQQRVMSTIRKNRL
jgi:flagellum-specific peptidoglycan hydrolase FlgJ